MKMKEVGLRGRGVLGTLGSANEHFTMIRLSTRIFKNKLTEGSYFPFLEI